MDHQEQLCMATKNLARTVIEGGRSRYNKFERRYSNRRTRRRVRDYARGLLFDAEDGEGTVAPQRQPVWKAHYDRLAAAERWLASFVGRPWDDVHSEIARRFDTRTIAGQHIVYDHLLPSVRGSGAGRWHPRFAIDDDGRLVRLPRWRYPSRWKLPPGKVRRSPRQVDDWARGRKVGRRGRLWFWFEPTAFVWKRCHDRWCWRDHVDEDGARQHREPNGRFRQTCPLTPQQAEYWAELTDDVQNELTFRLDD